MIIMKAFYYFIIETTTCRQLKTKPVVNTNYYLLSYDQSDACVAGTTRFLKRELQ